MDVAADDDHVLSYRVHGAVGRGQEPRVQARREASSTALRLEVHPVGWLGEGDPPSDLRIARTAAAMKSP